MVSISIEKQCCLATAGAIPKIGLVGHAGIGHAHGHSGLVQDDSVGFSCMISLLRTVYPVDLRIASV